MICPQCGTENKAGDRFCLECGTALDAPAPEAHVNGTDSAAAAAHSRLVRLDTPQQESYDLGNRAVIGRLDTCDVPVDDRSVSREHARLSRLRDGYVVEDLGSTNGTLVNQRRIDEAVILRPGDILTVGSIELRFEQQLSRPDAVPHDPPYAWMAPVAVSPDLDAPNHATGSAPRDHSGDASAGAHAVEPEAAIPEPARSATERQPIVSTGNEAAPVDGSEHLEAAAQVVEGPGGEDLIALADRLRDAIHAMAGENRSMRQALEAGETHGRALERDLEDVRRQLDEAEMDRLQLQERARLVEEGGRVHEAIWDALQSTPASPIDDDESESLHALLDSLADNPRDIGVLVSIAEHASAIRQVVDEAFQQRELLKTIRKLIEGN